MQHSEAPKKIYFTDLKQVFKSSQQNMAQQLAQLKRGCQLVYIDTPEAQQHYQQKQAPQLWVLVADRSYTEVIASCFPVNQPPCLGSPVLMLCTDPVHNIQVINDDLFHYEISFFPVNVEKNWIVSKMHGLIAQQEALSKPLVVPVEITDSLAMLEKLSRRELEILGFIGQGFSNREISQELILSEHSVRTHVYNIFTKLSIKRRSQAVLVDIYRKTTGIKA
jgi:DNA-binding CsgD family transcriptional regulator